MKIISEGKTKLKDSPLVFLTPICPSALDILRSWRGKEFGQHIFETTDRFWSEKEGRVFIELYRKNEKMIAPYPPPLILLHVKARTFLPVSR
jgi:hypothetical protein